MWPNYTYMYCATTIISDHSLTSPLRRLSKKKQYRWARAVPLDALSFPTKNDFNCCFTDKPALDNLPPTPASVFSTKLGKMLKALKVSRQMKQEPGLEQSTSCSYYTLLCPAGEILKATKESETAYSRGGSSGADISKENTTQASDSQLGRATTQY